MKFIVISGGVLSGLGKGITAASIGLLLKSRGVKVTLMKNDMYLNIDAGTMNPIEHGEVFVTNDGLETDQDLGHYERFTNLVLNKSNYLTNGQLYQTILNKERSLEYKGKCVEPYHHLPPEIIERWKAAGSTNKADVVIVELGGTVGEYEGLLFYEAYRRLKIERPGDVCLIHVGYLPAPSSIGELKSKPMQQSISALNSLGVSPDFIVGRAQKDVDLKRKEKIALMSGLPIENIISNPDLESVYFLPEKLEKEKLVSKIIKKLKIKAKKLDLSKWDNLVEKVKAKKTHVDIAVIGKYQKTGDYILSDSYVCVVEALKHASFETLVEPKITWVNSEELEAKSDKQVKEYLSKFKGIVVPQGWGKRGVEGKVKAIKYARENNVPYLGLCFGMQMAVIEFARNVLGYKDANTTEANPDTKHPVIHTMENQIENIKNKKYGGTIRLGAYPLKVNKKSVLYSIYKKENVLNERHRHRYEFNNKYKKEFEKKGLKVGGTSPDGKLVEAIEIPSHKFFVGTQFHPEYVSAPLSPHPIFVKFVTSLQS